MCNPGFIGESCSLSTLTDSKSNNWFTISSTSSVFSPRTAHSVVYVEKSDTLLAFGGMYIVWFWKKNIDNTFEILGRHVLTVSTVKMCIADLEYKLEPYHI